MEELNVFYKKILFATVHCIFQTRTMRILWAIFGTKMYIWYTAPLAKINYLGFYMFGVIFYDLFLIKFYRMGFFGLMMTIRENH